jgi:Holliday junction resolvase
MNTARKGAKFENDVRKMCEAYGFSVTRGAGSKGFFDSPEGEVKVDLIASKFLQNTYEIQIILVQCKVKGQKK